MKLLVSVVAVLVTLFASATLAQAPVKSPAEVAKAFTRAVWEGDQEAARALVTKGSKLDRFPAKGKEGSPQPRIVSTDVKVGRATVVL